MSYWLKDENRTIKRVAPDAVSFVPGFRQPNSVYNPKSTPLISTALESFRKSTFEVDFNFPSLKDSANLLTRAVKHVGDIGRQPIERIVTQDFDKRIDVDFTHSLPTTITFDNLLAKSKEGMTVASFLHAWYTFATRGTYGVAGIHQLLGAPLLESFKGRTLTAGEHWGELATSLMDKMSGPNYQVRGKQINKSWVNNITKKGVTETGDASTVVFGNHINVTSYSVDGEEACTYTLVGAWPMAVRTTELNSSENDFHTLEVDFRWSEVVYKPGLAAVGNFN